MLSDQCCVRPLRPIGAPVRIEIERLFKQAERDLENAGKAVNFEAYELASFVAHQAVEKALKAAWMFTKREASPRTHSLTELADGLSAPQSLRRHFVYLNPESIHQAHLFIGRRLIDSSASLEQA